MATCLQRKWQVLWLSLLLLGGGGLATQALLLDLDAYVQFSILVPDYLGTPLPDGAVVYIIGSLDANNDGMLSYPDGSTNLLAASVSNDDVILGSVRIGDNTSSNGTFSTVVKYNPDDVQYVYIRFFDYTNEPVVGYVYWGTSAVFHLGQTLGVSTVQFDPTTNLVASNQNNFVTVPEPSTAGLYLLTAGMLWALRAAARKRSTEPNLRSGEGRS